MTDHAKGLLITFIGGMILTIDIPFIIAAGGEVWSVLFLRSGCAAIAALVLWVGWRAINRNAPPLIPGWQGVTVAAIYGIAAIFFTAAVFYTSAAKLVFILAFNSMFAATLGWLILGERPLRVTVVTMFVLVGAVALIVSDGLESGTWVGDLCAICASFLLSVAITLTRRSGRDMGFAPMIGGVIPVSVAGVILLTSETGFQIEAPIWIILNGAIILPAAFWCLATGPKYITGPEVAMFYLLETVLTPIWVWLIFKEAVTGRTLIGGTIIVIALAAHSLVRLRTMSGGRSQAATPA
ncbi:MAG: DMT family transporter [Pseudomonadota bacterium]